MSFFKDLEVADNFVGVTTTKGDIIVHDETKNTRLPSGTNNQVLVSDLTTSTGLKWVTYADTTQITMSVTPLSTNSTVPIQITDFDQVPVKGSYVIMLNIKFSLSKATRNGEIKLYKNGSVIESKNIDTLCIGARTLLSFEHANTFNGTDTLSVKYSVDNTDVTMTLYSGTLILLRINN